MVACVVSIAVPRKGLWVDKKSHSLRLGFCSRSKDIIEPYLKPQWWMNCKDLADRSVNLGQLGKTFAHNTLLNTVLRCNTVLNFDDVQKINVMTRLVPYFGSHPR